MAAAVLPPAVVAEVAEAWCLLRPQVGVPVGVPVSVPRSASPLERVTTAEAVGWGGVG